MGDTRNRYVLAITVFVIYTGFAFVIPLLPLYVEELGVSDKVAAAQWAGVLIGVAPLLAGLLAPFWGRVGDRHGHKRTILLALLASSLFLGLSARVASPIELLWLRVGTGVFGGVGPLSLAMATGTGHASETGKAVGILQAAQILAAAVGPFGGGLVADWMGIRSTFVLTAGLGVLAILLVGTLYDAPPTLGDGKDRGQFWHVLRIPGTLLLVSVSFLVNFVGRSLTPILPLQLATLGIPEGRLASSTGALISVYALSAAISAYLLGRATRTQSPRRLLSVTLSLSGLFVFGMRAVPAFSPFLALAALLGLSSGGALTLCYTLGGRLAPGASRATAFGIFSGAALFGGALSPSVAGILARWDYRSIYSLDTAILLILGIALFLPNPKLDQKTAV